jgi:hypothetical protein
VQQVTSALSRRRHGGPKPLADCGSFATLAQRASVLEALDRALRQTLPSPLREQVRFADLRHDRLVFLASSSAWASRLRLAQTAILASAHAVGVQASGVRVKVVDVERESVPAERRKTLSPGAASHLRAAAAGFPDPELRALFLALASVTEAEAGPATSGPARATPRPPRG